ncbi:MAG: hypothetical protein EOP49_00735 [Sphingobacteriales bacterium]|nr:MAG: hypothetical protein EOP49_00735 [Sphingobacteriales bacterium]
MADKIKVGAVSYLNTKPLLYGIERSAVMDRIELSLEYPSELARKLAEGTVDLALMPVAAINDIEGAKVVSDYGIAADGKVASVCIYSQVPIQEVKSVYLDYQSRTSVRLAQLLFEKYWKQEVQFVPATEHFIDYIQGDRAGVIIGDRALKQLTNFEYVYDLATVWKDMTGLPFVFAAWVATRELPADFIEQFNGANATGLQHLEEIVSAYPFPYFDLMDYYTNYIHFHLDADKRKGLDLFLSMIR